jgi:GH35 family endo-1,4-beta-xylanase
VNTRTITIDIVRDSLLIHESVVVRLASCQATCNFALMFWGLTENESWSNQQDRQHKQAASHGSPLSD